MITPIRRLVTELTAHTPHSPEKIIPPRNHFGDGMAIANKVISIY